MPSSSSSSFRPTATLTHIHSSFLCEEEDPLYYHPMTRTFAFGRASSSSSFPDDGSYYEYDLDTDDDDDGNTTAGAVHDFCDNYEDALRGDIADDSSSSWEAPYADDDARDPPNTTAAVSRHDRLPDYFRCPISRDRMRDPVMDADGHSYERKQIVFWLAWHATSPMTRRPMTMEELRPNRALRCAIEAWCSGGRSKDAVVSEDERGATKPPPSATILEHTGKSSSRTRSLTCDADAVRRDDRESARTTPPTTFVQLTHIPPALQANTKDRTTAAAYA